MYDRTFIFVENFHVNNLSVVLEIFMCLIFVGQGYPRKLFNLEHFPIYGNSMQNKDQPQLHHTWLQHK